MNKKGGYKMNTIIGQFLAIFLAVFIPALSGYSSNAKKTNVLADCKSQVTGYSAAIVDVLSNKDEFEITSTDNDSIIDDAVGYGVETVSDTLKVKVASDATLIALYYEDNGYECAYTADSGKYISAKEGNNTDADIAFENATAPDGVDIITLKPKEIS